MEWWMILLIVYFGLAFVMGVIINVTRVYTVRVWPFALYVRRRRLEQPVTYAGKMKELTSRLVGASRAVDEVLMEMTEANRRQETILSQQAERMETLSTTEKELQQRVESLKEVPLPVADYFVELNRKAQQEQEKKRTSRDYKLIIISAVLSAALTVAIMALFG